MILIYTSPLHESICSTLILISEESAYVAASIMKTKPSWKLQQCTCFINVFSFGCVSFLCVNMSAHWISF